MNWCALLTVSLALMLQTGYCKDLFSITGSSSSQSQDARKPFFTSRADNYKARVGGEVTLVCKVENLGESTVIWKESDRIISAGEILIRKDRRLSIVGGFNLKIRDLREEDAGKYVCEIETFGAPLDQSNTLEILVPPSVSPQPSDGKFVVRKGSTITLECEARGNPTPVITWERTHDLLPSGQKTSSGRSIVIADVSRHHSGVYLCTASNQVGEPAVAEIDLKVLYAPEIEVEQSWIRDSSGISAQLSCNVHSEPRAEVRWYKDTMLLEASERRTMEAFGDRHVLTVSGVGETDFGNYSCAADNSLGRQRGFLDVSGRPHPAKIVSPSKGYFKDQYNLTWTVDSFLPIEEYRILYRVATPSFSRSHQNQSPYQLQQQQQQPRSYNSRPRQNRQQQRDSDWTNIIPTIPDQRINKNDHRPRSSTLAFTYTGNFVFYGLRPQTEYEVIIQSRNREGWSDPNDIYRFKTRKTDYNPLGLASHNSHTGGAGANCASAILLSFAASIAVHNLLSIS